MISVEMQERQLKNSSRLQWNLVL